MLATQRVDAFSRCLAGHAQEVSAAGEEKVVDTVEKCLSYGQTVVAVYMGDSVQYVVKTAKSGRQPDGGF